jgi:enamine deaminase RidA (YjgF/YER057c/UK114 family)
MTNGADFERCWPAMGKAFGEVRPAATMMVVGLADPRMKIEIEVTALRKKSAPRKKKAKAARRKK